MHDLYFTIESADWIKYLIQAAVIFSEATSLTVTQHSQPSAFGLFKPVVLQL